MYLAMNKYIPGKNWLHKVDLTNKKGETVESILI